MLKLNIKESKDGNKKSRYLNTSHVKVKRTNAQTEDMGEANLNTSHVKVKLNLSTAQFSIYLFKYISC